MQRRDRLVTVGLVMDAGSRAFDDRPEVVQLAQELVAPGPVAVVELLEEWPPGQVVEELGVGGHGVVEGAGGGEAVEGEALDHLQQPEARLTVLGVGHRDQGGVDQLEQDVRHVGTDECFRWDHRLDRVERGAGLEDAQPVEDDLLGGLEEVVAPGDRGPDRALPLVAAALGAREVQALVDPGQDGLGGEQLGPGGGELDRQGQAVEGLAELRDVHGVVGGELEALAHPARVLDEQLHGGRRPISSTELSTAGTDRGDTAYSTSPPTCRGRLEVATIVRCCASRSRTSTTSSASGTCSRLSRTTSVVRSAT